MPARKRGSCRSCAGIARLDQIDAAEILREMWDCEMPPDEEDEEEGEPWTAVCALFTKTFPGLAPPGDMPVGTGQLDDVLGSAPPRRIGLVPAARPADVLPLVGWTRSGQ